MEGDEQNSGWPIASFFKLILEARDDLCKLEIPPKFVTLHGKNLFELVTLQVPSGKVWHVQLVRENGKINLQNGWRIFAKFYSLSNGHFLKFDFVGNSCFKVIIIDMSASEIEYPCLHFTPCDTPHESPTNKGKSTSIPTTSSKEVVKDNALPSNIIVSKTGRTDDLTTKEIKKIKAHISANPIKHPSFATKFPSRYSKNYLGIPSEFAKKYMDTDEEGDLIIETKDGKKWKICTSGSVPRLKLGKGCRRFVKDNNLGVDDICIFQLIDKQRFKVDILRAAPAKKVVKRKGSTFQDCIFLD